MRSVSGEESRLTREPGAASSELLVVGVDIGASKILVSLVDGRGRSTHTNIQPTRPERGAKTVIADVVRCIRKACLPAAGGHLVATGVGVAGQVDPVTGTVHYAPNLGWDEVPLGQRLVEELGLPVVVLNDVQAATYGECMYGAGRGVDELVGLFIGTGVGGGIVTRGQLVHGASGSAGELGHITIDLRGPLCRCGNRGCLEAFAGGWAIARRAQERVAADPAAGAGLLAQADGRPVDITSETVAQAARSGDPLALAIIGEVSDALGAGVASIVNAFNPALIVIGGGVAAGLPELIDRARTAVDERALRSAASTARIVPAMLGAGAVSVGAAAWAGSVIGRGVSSTTRA